ncbi:hypothetical protein PVL29_005097 [Vitis rotundifolia]|uniref:Uncharacterized protein n=1 Tax=Vitis rotundifolia TaxID=103349 RepID=A0AA39AAT8_VITRO|nr:hypothetical protein PVL29_005097 [Vitis rotundifolia]
MAAFVACRYTAKIGTGKSNTTSAIPFLASLSSFSSPSGYCRRSDYRPFSQFVKSMCI